MLGGDLVGLLVAGALLAWIVGTGIVIVQQQSVRMVETFGRFSSVRQAGLSFKLPWPIQTVTRPLSLKVHEIAQDVSVKSIDNAFVVVPIRVQFAVAPAEAFSAFYKLSDPSEQIKSYIVNQVRATASGLTFNELFQSRDVFEADVRQTLEAQMREYGFVISNVLVDDPQPSSELRTAFDRVLASERLKEAAANEGEAEKILRVKQAEAEKAAMELKAQAFANFRTTVAEGNAEALKVFVKDIPIAPETVLRFFAEINQMEAIRDAAASGGRTVVVAGQPDLERALTGMLAEEGKDA